jgi:hypothetical protein
MEAKTARRILTQKEPPRLYDVVDPVLNDTGLRDELIEGSFAKNETLRYNSVRVLFRALDQKPELFYSYWDRFTKMIDSSNSFHRAAAGQAIAFLAVADTDCRLDPIFSHYLRLLDDPSVMVSHYFLDTLDRVCRARPELQPRIVKALLNFDQTHHLPPRKELLKADVLALLDRLFESLPIRHRKRAVAFAQACLQSPPSRTRKTAKLFLARRAVQA